MSSSRQVSSLRRRGAAVVCGAALATMVAAARGDEVAGPSAVPSAAPEPDDRGSRPVRLNTVGYLPDAAKLASFPGEAAPFRVVRTTDERTVLAGQSSVAVLNNDTGERLSTVNFSELAESGVYRVHVEGIGASPEFCIDRSAYNAPFYTVMRGMTLWRCGAAVSGRHRGETFAHAACHQQDAKAEVAGQAGVVKDGAGGWHDAGDYNKYVVNAGVTVGMMLQAWDHFGDRLAGLALDVPESGDEVPDYLDEIRWELDWVLTCQQADGSVLHKLSTKAFGPFIPPEEETTPRFFAPWSSAATADLAALGAWASRAFAPYDAEFAARCLAAARASHRFLARSPENRPADLTGFSTGTYQTDDADDRLWAAVELWRTTGEEAYLREAEERIGALADRAGPEGSVVDFDWDWSNVRNLGLYGYALSDRPERDPRLVERVRRDVVRTADELAARSLAHGYGRPLGERYYWGCNGGVARTALTLEAARRIAPDPRYRAAQLRSLDYLFGRNYYGRCFVTGLGLYPPRRPHDRRNSIGGANRPWPGYLVGGGWPKATDWRDEEANYRTNEIAINWNGALVYALAPLVEPDTFDLARANK